MNLRGIWQAAYTAGVVLPKPVATCQYWHRSLNPKKLIDIGFSRLQVQLRQTIGSFPDVYTAQFIVEDAYIDVAGCPRNHAARCAFMLPGAVARVVTQMCHPAGAHDHGADDQAVQAIRGDGHAGHPANAAG